MGTCMPARFWWSCPALLRCCPLLPPTSCTHPPCPCLPIALPSCCCSGYVIKARFQQDMVAAKVFDLSKSRELRVGSISGRAVSRPWAQACWRLLGQLQPAVAAVNGPLSCQEGRLQDRLSQAACPSQCAPFAPLVGPLQESFLTECSRLAHLRHPNIISLLGISLTRNKGIMLLELAEGGQGRGTGGGGRGRG